MRHGIDPATIGVGAKRDAGVDRRTCRPGRDSDHSGRVGPQHTSEDDKAMKDGKPASQQQTSIPAPAPTATPLRYRVTPVDPDAHQFEVELEVAEPDPHGQRVTMPAWTPGSYLIREFARHVVSIDARTASGRRIPLTKIDKATWQAPACAGPLQIRYRVHAHDLSVRGAHLDAEHGFFNGSSLLMQAVGHDSRACELLLEPPVPRAGSGGRAGREPARATAGEAAARTAGRMAGKTLGKAAAKDSDTHSSSGGPAGWRVATTMPRAGAPEYGFGRYRARDYAELIDHPVEMGEFTLASFDVGGARHEIALTGRHDADTRRLCRDLRRICAAHIRLFEPRRARAPFERYLFQVFVVGDGYGGLEHRSSTSLICARRELPWKGEPKEPSEDYRSFLGLASHEYFHAWNVKRIRPAAFIPYDLQNEDYTRLLWIFEGFTSYYDDLMLVRSGVIGVDAYLQVLARTISGVQRAPGHEVQSVAESSFDAWIKFYRQDENSPNALASYYAKGSLVALALDLEIRTRTDGRRSLDDVMRLMWQRYGRKALTGGADGGLGEDGFPSLLAEATGLRLDRQIRAWAYGTDRLPLSALLRRVGVRFASGAGDQGPTTLGVRLAERHGQLTITTAYNGQAAERAGLSAGDVLIAADGLRVDEKTLKALLARRRPGERLRVHGFRRDELIEREVVLQAPLPTETKLSVHEKAGTAARALRRDWLGR